MRTFEEPRPTSVTVIGWAWIIIGGLMCLSAAGALAMSPFAASSATGARPNVPAFFFWLFPLTAMVQLCIGLTGAVSGVYFLKLRRWSRRVLESLTWLLLVLIVGFAIFWIGTWISMSSSSATGGLGGGALVFACAIFAFYCVPLGIMLKTLRGPRVANAFAALPAAEQEDEAAEQNQPPGSQGGVGG